MKIHINLATANLKQSVSFYSTLLDARPAKVQPDYALFVTEQPGIELALDLRESVQSITDVDYGIYVETATDVERAIDRLTTAGLATSIERKETCCYANQTKVWAADPDGRRWEIYTVHEDVEERNDADAPCCSPSGDARVCCTAP